MPYLVEREGTSNENLPETHDVIRHIRAHLDSRYHGRMLLAEANMWPEDAQLLRASMLIVLRTRSLRRPVA